MWSLLGIVLSAGWLAVAYLWFDGNIGLENYSYVLLPEVVGQYVAGLLAPLILIWVLLGYLRGPRGLQRLLDEVATLRESLAERERRDAPRPRSEPPVAPPLRRSPEAMAPIAAAPVVEALPPAPSPLPKRPPVATPAPTPVAPLVTPVPTAAASLSVAASPTAPASNVTSLAQEVARSLGRLNSEVEVPAALDVEAGLDDDFRQLVHRVGRDLNAICMDLSAVLCRKSARDEALKAYNRGHKEAFHVVVRDYLSRHEPAEIMTRLTQADAQSLLHTYAMKFASLIDEAARRDPSGAQEAALRRGAMGQLYEEVQRHTYVARGAARL